MVPALFKLTHHLSLFLLTSFHSATKKGLHSILSFSGQGNRFVAAIHGLIDKKEVPYGNWYTAAFV
jgi:hypothetical protein